MKQQPKVLPIGLTDRGRIRATMFSLEQAWPNLTADQQAAARDLVAQLANVYRATAPRPAERVRVPLISRIAG